MGCCPVYEWLNKASKIVNIYSAEFCSLTQDLGSHRANMLGKDGEMLSLPSLRYVENQKQTTGTRNLIEHMPTSGRGCRKINRLHLGLGTER